MQLQYATKELNGVKARVERRTAFESVLKHAHRAPRARRPRYSRRRRYGPAGRGRKARGEPAAGEREQLRRQMRERAPPAAVGRRVGRRRRARRRRGSVGSSAASDSRRSRSRASPSRRRQRSSAGEQHRGRVRPSRECHARVERRRPVKPSAGKPTTPLTATLACARKRRQQASPPRTRRIARRLRWLLQARAAAWPGGLLKVMRTGALGEGGRRQA